MWWMKKGGKCIKYTGKCRSFLCNVLKERRVQKEWRWRTSKTGRVINRFWRQHKSSWGRNVKRKIRSFQSWRRTSGQSRTWISNLEINYDFSTNSRVSKIKHCRHKSFNCQFCVVVENSVSHNWKFYTSEVVLVTWNKWPTAARRPSRNDERSPPPAIIFSAKREVSSNYRDLGSWYGQNNGNDEKESE